MWTLNIWHESTKQDLGQSEGACSVYPDSTSQNCSHQGANTSEPHFTARLYYSLSSVSVTFTKLLQFKQGSREACTIRKQNHTREAQRQLTNTVQTQDLSLIDLLSV